MSAQAVDVHVVPVVGGVAVDQPLGGEQFALDGLDGGDHPLVVARQEPESGDEQERRVQVPAAVVLGEHPALGVESVGADVGVDFVAHLPQVLHHGLGDGAPARKEGGGAIEEHPGQDAGMSEVAARAAHLPDPLAGLAPALLQLLGQREQQRVTGSPGRPLQGSISGFGAGFQSRPCSLSMDRSPPAG
ncbi:hypothetical protein BG452_02700 [Streptomyces sp. CBMA123]|nr:hypothetical protein [Streptomyces sp. CBMA123]